MLLDKPTYQRVDSKRNFYLGSLAVVGVVAAAVALFSSGSQVQPVSQTLVLAQSAECPAFTDLEWKGVKFGLKVFDTNKDNVFTYAELSASIKVQGDAAKQAAFNQLDLNKDGIVDFTEICTSLSKLRASIPKSLLQYATEYSCDYQDDP